MKKAVILHGTDGSPEENWFPWLKAKLEAVGYEVWVPLLPGNHTPNRETYAEFLLGSGWDFSDNIVVGHSAGAVEVLNLLMDDRFPRIRLAVAAAAWAGGDPLDNDEGWLEKGQFSHLFPEAGFDFAAIKNKAGKIAFLHGSDDPYCPLEQAEYLAEQLDAPLTIVENGKHLGSNFREFPELWQILEPHL